MTKRDSGDDERKCCCEPQKDVKVPERNSMWRKTGNRRRGEGGVKQRMTSRGEILLVGHANCDFLSSQNSRRARQETDQQVQECSVQ